ncbi:MAG: porin family protein [Muribaculaceae bacterium]|nr:porin family protein [Muribaculaceae bacterium]
MKIAKRIVLMLLLAVAFALPADAQIRFGVKAGLAINDLKFNKELVNSSNRKGFTGGVMAEFTVPVIGLGMDASLMYARRSFEIAQPNEPGFSSSYETMVTTDNRDYLSIPINLKYKVNIPVVSKIIVPFVTTGPDFSILLSKKNVSNAWHNRKYDTAWTLGGGVELFSHLQVAATYGWGLSKSSSNDSGVALYGKNRCWTVTAAYLF